MSIYINSNIIIIFSLLMFSKYNPIYRITQVFFFIIDIFYE